MRTISRRFAADRRCCAAAAPKRFRHAAPPWPPQAVPEPHGFTGAKAACRPPGPKNWISFFSLSAAVECRWICSSSRPVRLSKRSSRPEFARFCQENWPREARDRAGPRCARLIVADAGGAFISLAHSAPACSLFVVRLNFGVRCRRRAPAQQGKKKAREALQEERQAPCKKSCCMSRSRTFRSNSSNQ